MRHGRPLGLLLLLLGVLWSAVGFLNAPADVASAVDVALDNGALIILAVAVVVLLLSIEPIQDRVFGQAELKFSEPRVDETTAFGALIATGPAGTPRFVGLPPALAIETASGSNTSPFLASQTLHSPTFPWFLFLRVRNVSRKTRAQEVRAEYVVRHQDGTVAFALDARWRESPQVASGVDAVAIKDIIDIPAGRSAELDFAVQHRDRDYACVYNTEVTSSSSDWCPQMYQLAPGHYWLKARVICLNARTLTDWFEVVIGGLGMQPAIRQGTPPPRVR